MVENFFLWEMAIVNFLYTTVKNLYTLYFTLKY